MKCPDNLHKYTRTHTHLHSYIYSFLIWTTAIWLTYRLVVWPTTVTNTTKQRGNGTATEQPKVEIKLIFYAKDIHHYFLFRCHFFPNRHALHTYTHTFTYTNKHTHTHICIYALLVRSTRPTAATAARVNHVSLNSPYNLVFQCFSMPLFGC